MKLQITTNYGDVYTIEPNGNIRRMDQPYFQPSGQWKLVGIENVKSFRDFIRFENIAEWLKTKPELLYKNGNPRYTVRDFDHGTIRSWGNTKYHGIRHIAVLTA